MGGSASTVPKMFLFDTGSETSVALRLRGPADGASKMEEHRSGVSREES